MIDKEIHHMRARLASLKRVNLKLARGFVVYSSKTYILFTPVDYSHPSDYIFIVDVYTAHL